MRHHERVLPALPTNIYHEPDHKIQAALTHLKFRTPYLPSKLLELVYPWQPRASKLRKHLDGYGCITISNHDRSRTSADRHDDAEPLPFNWILSVKFDLREEANKHPGMIRPECVNCVVMRSRTRPGCIQYEAVTGQKKLQIRLPTFR